MTILAKNLTLEELNACFLRLQRSMQNEKASLDGKVTNIISGSSKSNNNAYNDNALRQLIKALQDLTAEHTKSINSLTDKTKDNSDKIAQLSTKLSQINFAYDPETKTITFTGADGKPKIYTLTDTTYTFSFDETTQTLTIHNDLDVVPNPNWDPNDPESPQYIPDDTHDFVQQIKGTTYTFTWSNGSLTIHNNLSTEEHPIADVVINFDNRYYTETEIDAFINALDARLDYIEDRIPQEATPENKLADKNWVARAISISAATFRGTFNSLADLQAYSGPKDQNDFAFVKTSTGYDQYTWVPSGSSGSWTYEFSLETLAGSLSVEVDNCNHSVYLAGTTTCSGCDNITTLCGSADIHFNPVKRQLFANNMVLDPDETCSGSYSGGLRINRGLVSGADYWNGLILGGQRGTTCGCNEAWWLGNDYSTNNVSGNNGKLFVTYEGAAVDNQRRGYFTKSNSETFWRGNVSGNIYKDADFVNWKSIDLSGLDSNTIYPVVFSLRGDNSITRIRIRNALDGAPVPSWATHSSGFAAELDMYDQPYGWGIIGRRTYVRQADMNWVSVDASQVWGYSQLTNTSIGVLWLRGGAVWRAWNSVDTSFTVITSTWDDGTGDTVAPVTPGNQPTLYTSNGVSYDTVSNAVNATCANYASITNQVYMQSSVDINCDLAIPVARTPTSAEAGCNVYLGLPTYQCVQQKPTFNPATATFKSQRIVAAMPGCGCIGSFGYNTDTINNAYSSIVPYVCILPQVNNEPLFVRVCFLQDRNLAGGHIHISHWQFDSTINLDQAGEQSLAYYCGATYGTTCFSIPSYTCYTQYLWLYFANSWWSPRISADIPFCVDTYRSTTSAQDAEVNLGGGWHAFTDLRNSGGSVDNATCFNGYTWAQACAIFTGSVTPSVRCDNTFYQTLGIDSNGNIIKQGNPTMWFNPGTQMNAMCAITTDPIGGLSSYYEGLRLNRSCVSSGDSWTTLLIGDCWGTYSGNCDGIWIGRHHNAADNQKLFFTWQGATNNCGYMYFPTAGQGACWCGNVYGQARDNIKSFLGIDGLASNTGDWHKMVTTSGLSNGQWQHVLNLNWTDADNEWTSRLYLPTNYMTSCKHMYFSTGCAGCAWEVLDNGGDTQYKTGGINASWFGTAGITPNKMTGTLSCGVTYYIHLYDIYWGDNAYRGTVDVDYSIYGSGVVDTINLRASSNGYDNSLESMGVCLNRTSYGAQSSTYGAYGLVGIGFIHNTAYQGSLQVWGKFIAYDNWDYTQYLGMNFVNTRNLGWYGNGITTTSPSFTCFVCVKPNGQKAFHWFNGEVDGVVNYAVNAECSSFAFAACCATSISVPVCSVIIPAGCVNNYIRLSCGTSTRGTWHIYDTNTTFDVTFDRGNSGYNLCWKRSFDAIAASCSSLLFGAALGFTSSENGLLVRVSTLSGCASVNPRTFYISYEDETGPKAPPYTPSLVCCSGWSLNPHCFVTSNYRFSYDGSLNNGNQSQSSQCVCASSRMVIPVGVTSNVSGAIWIE